MGTDGSSREGLGTEALPHASAPARSDVTAPDPARLSRAETASPETVVEGRERIPHESRTETPPNRVASARPKAVAEERQCTSSVPLTTREALARQPRATSTAAGLAVFDGRRLPQLPEPDFDAMVRVVRTPLLATTSAPGATKQTSPTITIADAMHVEEVRRTRQFIAIGWAVSAGAAVATPFLGAARWMNIAMIAALVWGIVMSSVFYRRFTDPAKFTPAALSILGVFAIINTQVAVMYFGVFTPCAAIIVLGIHFMARSEATRTIRLLFVTGVLSYLASALIIIAGVVDDPGVFASTAPQSRSTLAMGALFVIGCYALAFYTGRAIRATSLASIDGLQRQTRLAAQRKALMDELRADLERALRVGGPGRHTEQTVGSFKLGNVIGRGAMGEVYEATHTENEEPAAVKLLRRELLTDPTHVARFLRESKASNALASAHVVRILEASVSDEVLPFLAMERLYGETLAEVLRQSPRVPAATVVTICKQIGAGVDAAGAAGIVHRDLKPQNMMLASQPGRGQVWKILDFGVATLSNDSGTLTRGDIIGTPSYMAPEQAKGDRVDSRADVYALAAVAYRCLTGRPPFTATDTPALLFAVVHRMPMRPGELGPFGDDIDRWAAIALAKSPDDRFATGAELSDALAFAVCGELDAKLRRRGDALIKKHGWEVGA